MKFCSSNAPQKSQKSRAPFPNLQSELLGDDGEISDGIDATLDVRDVLVFEGARHVENGVARFDVRQERVAQALTLRRT